jgi:hypothetical protein
MANRKLNVDWLRTLGAPEDPVATDTASAWSAMSLLKAVFGNISRIAMGTYTVATLPSAATSGSGARAFVSDAKATTFASTVAGGGANFVPVYSDGANWKIG